MSGKKLAKAAALQLKGVIVEYDAMCSTLIGRSVIEQAEELRRKEAQRAKEESAKAAITSAGGLFNKMSSMFMTDVRSLLTNSQQDSAGKSWMGKDRVQSTLQGLPTEVLERVTGENATGFSGKSEEEEYLAKQLASATAESERRAAEKQDLIQKRLQDPADNTGDTGARAKYLDKLNALKAKAKTRSPTEALATFTGVTPEAPSEPTSAKGLTTWLVNKGANELLTYANLRGLVKAATPPQSHVQEEEYRLFCKEMEAQFDCFMPEDDYRRLPDPSPIAKLCEEMDLNPVDVLVIARHSSTIRAARSAGAHTCHFMKSETEIPNHSADYQLTNLAEVQYIVEDFNGISYRGRVIH